MTKSSRKGKEKLTSKGGKGEIEGRETNRQTLLKIERERVRGVRKGVGRG